MSFQYACIAGIPTTINGIEKFYRCRRWAQDPPNNLFCAGHQNHPTLASLPDRVFVKMTLPHSPDNMRDIEEFCFHVVDRDREKQQILETKHAQHAQKFGREAYSVRKNTSDSGVQIFGRDGIHDMSMMFVDGNLIKVGLERIGGHVLDKAHEGKLVFVVEYTSIPNPTATKIPTRTEPYLRRLLGNCWGTIHIWANPPRVGDGVIVHTINAGSLKRDKIPSGNVILAEGFWSFKAIGGSE